MTTADFEIEKIDWLCSKLGIRSGPISILSAFSNTGKTFFAGTLAICVAKGQTMLGEIEMEQSGKVLHLDWDQDKETTDIYYWRLLNGLNLEGRDNIHYEKPSWSLVDANASELLQQKLIGYKLAIIDCLTSAVPGQSINSDKVRQYIDMLNDVSTKTKCAILLIHHEPKGADSKDALQNIKGSGAIVSAAGGSIHLNKNENGSIHVSLGKKRLTKDFSMDYNLKDSGGYSTRIKSATGIVLVPVAKTKTINKTLPKTMSFIKDLISSNKKEISSLKKMAVKSLFSQAVSLIKPKKRRK